MTPYSLGLRPAPLAGGMPPFVQAALSQATAVVAKYGGRMYFNPVGFDPYAFLNSDGSGGLSNAPGQLVGTALDLSRGVGSGTDFVAPLNFTNWTITGSTTVLSANSFSTSAANSGFVKSFSGLVTGRSYVIRAVGTTTASSGNLILRGNITSLPNLPLRNGPGSFDVTQQVVWTETSSQMFLFSQQPATVTFTALEIRPAVSSITDAATQATNANKPILAEGPTPWFQALSFDGVNDSLTTAALPPAAEETFCVAVLAPTLPIAAVAARRDSGSAAGEWAIGAAAPSIYRFAAWDTSGTVLVADSVTPAAAGVYSTLTVVKSTTNIELQFNETAPVVTSGTFGATAVATRLQLSSAVSGLLSGSIAAAMYLPVAGSPAERAILRRLVGICAGTITS
jgi:hypothetical protein